MTRDTNARGLAAKALGLAMAGERITVNARLPKQTDDASKGYSSATVWQYIGEIYTPVDLTNAGAAVWGPSGRAQKARIGDLLGASTVGLYGTIAMKAGYVGAAVDVQCTIAASPVTVTANILPSGELDVATLMASLALSDAGTKWFVTKVYDQSGSGFHLTQFGANAFPLFLYDPRLRRYCIAWDDKAVKTALAIPAGVSLSPRSHTAVLLGRSTVAADGGGGILYSLGTFVSGSDPCFVVQTTSFGGIQAFGNPAGGTQAFPQPSPLLDNSGSVVIVAAGASNTVCSVNEMASTTASPALPNSTLTGGIIGNDNISGSRYGAMHLIGFALANTQASATVRTAIRRSAYVTLDMAPQAPDTVVCIGDSRFSGFLADEQFSLPEAIRHHVTLPCRFFNFGKGSQTMQSMQIDTTPQAVRYATAGAKNIAVVMGGVNDWILDNTKTAATTLGYLQGCVAALKAAGFKVIVLAELAYSSTPGNTFLQAYRAAIIASQAAGTLGADVLIDPSQYAPVLAPSNTNFYADGLHPQGNLNMMLGAIIEPYVSQFLS